MNQSILLRDIDLEIKKGQLVIIIGEIGSGKSSLLNAILGQLLYVPQSELEAPVFKAENNLSQDEIKKEVEALNDRL